MHTSQWTFNFRKLGTLSEKSNVKLNFHFVKSMGSNNLQETFDEVKKIEKEMVSLKVNPRVEGLYLTSTYQSHHL